MNGDGLPGCDRSRRGRTLVRLHVQPCLPAELHQFGRGVKIFRVALTLLVKPEGALLGQRAHTNSDLRHEAEIDLTALHCLERTSNKTRDFHSNTH